MFADVYQVSHSIIIIYICVMFRLTGFMGYDHPSHNRNQKKCMYKSLSLNWWPSPQYEYIIYNLLFDNGTCTYIYNIYRYMHLKHKCVYCITAQPWSHIYTYIRILRLLNHNNSPIWKNLDTVVTPTSHQYSDIRVRSL